MKIKFLPALVGLFLTTSTFTSCLDTEVTEMTYSSDSSIKSFSLGTLKIKVLGNSSHGIADSAYIDTMSMGDYPFTIDQINRTIENKDSLPVGTDISKVITKITADSNYILYGKKTSADGEPTDTLWTSTDSIDFSFGPLQFQVTAYDLSKGRPYTVKINVHTQDPDSLIWHSVYDTHTFTTDLTEQKAIYKDNKIYVFGIANGTPTLQYTTISYNSDFSGAVPGAWKEMETPLPQNTDPYSATLWNNEIYFLAQSKLYKLTTNGYEEIQVANATEGFSQLISGHNTTLYARKANTEKTFTSLTVSNGAYSCTDDGDGSAPIIFPATAQPFSAVTVPASHNNTLYRTIVMSSGETASEKTGIVCSRLSSDNSWITYTQPDILSCPNITNPTMIYYNKKLYAFGGASKASDGTHEAFALLYSSTDNGLSWDNIAIHETFAKPTEDDKTFTERYAETQSYSCTVDEHNFIWIIWGDGSMSRGRINHLGFAPKW